MMKKYLVMVFIIVFLCCEVLYSKTLNEALKLYYDGKYKDALISFRTLSQDNNYKSRDLALYYSGLVSETLGRPEEALTYYQSLKEKYPESSMVEYANIRINELSGIKIKQHVERASRINKNIQVTKQIKIKKNDVVIKVKSGESLSKIAIKYYGKMNYYKKIASYNNIKYPYIIYAGQRLVLPGLGKIKNITEPVKKDIEVKFNREDNVPVIKFPKHEIKEEPKTEIKKETFPVAEVTEVPPASIIDTKPIKIEIKTDPAQEIWDKSIDEFKAEKFIEALKDLKEVINKYPESNIAPRARYFRGFIFYALGNLIQAVPEYISAAKMSPQDPIADDALYSAAEIYFYVLKDYKKAGELYNILQKMTEEPILENGFPLRPLISRRLEEIKLASENGITGGENTQKLSITLPPPVFRKTKAVISAETVPVSAEKISDTATDIQNKIEKPSPTPASVSQTDTEKLLAQAIKKAENEIIESKQKEKTVKPDTFIEVKPEENKIDTTAVTEPVQEIKKPVFTPTPKPYGRVEDFSDVVMLENAEEVSDYELEPEKYSAPEKNYPTISMKKDNDDFEMEVSMPTREDKKFEVPKGEKYQSNLHLRLAKAYKIQAMPSEAIREYEEALKYDPDNPVTYNNLAYIYVEEGSNLDRAEELIKKALSLNPPHKGYYFDTLGLAFLKQGRFQESVFYFKKSIEEKKTPERLYHLGNAYIKLNLKNEAIAAFNEAYSISGGSGLIAQKVKNALQQLR